MSHSPCFKKLMDSRWGISNSAHEEGRTLRSFPGSRPKSPLRVSTNTSDAEELDLNPTSSPSSPSSIQGVHRSPSPTDSMFSWSSSGDSWSTDSASSDEANKSTEALLFRDSDQSGGFSAPILAFEMQHTGFPDMYAESTIQYLKTLYFDIKLTARQIAQHFRDLGYRDSLVCNGTRYELMNSIIGALERMAGSNETAWTGEAGGSTEIVLQDEEVEELRRSMQMADQNVSSGVIWYTQQDEDFSQMQMADQNVSPDVMWYTGQDEDFSQTREPLELD